MGWAMRRPIYLSFRRQRNFAARNVPLYALGKLSRAGGDRGTDRHRARADERRRPSPASAWPTMQRRRHWARPFPAARARRGSFFLYLFPLLK